MTAQELKQYIDRVLGSSIRCLLPSYWWKRLFGVVVDVVDAKADKTYVDDALSKVPTSIDSSLSSTSTNPVENKTITNELSKKQTTLVSGQNIKTINNKSILGSGNIDIQECRTIYIQNDASAAEFISDSLSGRVRGFVPMTNEEPQSEGYGEVDSVNLIVTTTGSIVAHLEYNFEGVRYRLTYNVSVAGNELSASFSSKEVISSGGGTSSTPLLNEWYSYDASMTNYALSAKLGYELYGTLDGINSLLDNINGEEV